LGAVVETLLGVLFVGGMSLLAQWSRKNPAAEISLLVILFSIPCLAIAAILLLVALGVLPAPDTWVLSAVSAAIIVLASLAGISLCILPLLKILRRTQRAARYAEDADYKDPEFPESHTLDDRFSGWWWSDPPVFFALWIFVAVLAVHMISLFAFALDPESVSSGLSSIGRLSPFAVLVSQLPLVIVALCGVGFGIRRNLRETLNRLGYGPITLPQLGIVALFVVGALLLSFAADWLFATLQPDLFERVGEVSEGLLSPRGLSPAAAILFALLIGLGAGIGEETLFRGAVQPRLGITLTSVLWAAVHVQYGPSVILIYIFVLSLALGYLRNRINTTATFITHSTYNFLTMLLTYFLGGY
jgi:membrane protease YdiL (CAAX protease family)